MYIININCHYKQDIKQKPSLQQLAEGNVELKKPKSKKKRKNKDKAKINKKPSVPKKAEQSVLVKIMKEVQVSLGYFVKI